MEVDEMRRGMLAAIAVVGLAPGAMPATAASPVTSPPFDCGSKKLMIWLWPKGAPQGWAGGSKSSRPEATGFNGWGAASAANTAVSIHAGTAGVQMGLLCAPPKGTTAKLPATAAALTWVSRAIRVRCAFPTTPLIQIQTSPLANQQINDAKQRLNIVLDRRTLVVTADVTVTTAKLGYARKYCSPVPG